MKIINKLAMISALVVLFACSENDPEPAFETDLTEITSFSQDGITITLYAQETFFVGFNAIAAKIERDGSLISGEATVQPMMQMMEMAHAAPREYVSGMTFEDGLFEFNVVFVMPSGDMGSWTLNFDVDGTALSVPVEVVSPDYARMVSFTSAMDERTRYFVALVSPDEPEVGKNELEIAVYKRASMMDWPAVTDLSFELEPWMVSMDHGSPNNVAPVHHADGHYMGEVNFTMTGDWQIRLTAMQGSEVCGEPYFDIYFQ
ncbi:MAG: hypothetical protein Tsb0034_01930 [Ekhidna sp.]